MVRWNDDPVIDEIHRVRDEISREIEGMRPEERASFMNAEADAILKKWGVELQKADYLLKAVK